MQLTSRKNRSAKISLLLAVLFSLFVTAGTRVQAALAFTYLDPVATEIDYQLSIATNAVPLNKRLVTSLKAARNQINRPVAATVVNDIRTLTLVSTTLSRSSVSNAFWGPLIYAISDYAYELNNSYDNLSARVDVAYPSGLAIACRRNLDQAKAYLNDAIYELNPIVASILVNRAVAKIRVVELVIPRAEAVLPGANFLRATINGAGFLSRGRLLTIYNSGSSFVQLTGVMVSLRSGKEVLVAFNNLSEGKNVLYFDGYLGDATGYFAVSGTGGSFSGTATSGTAVVIVDSIKGAIYGTFSFDDGYSAVNNGSFSVRLN